MTVNAERIEVVVIGGGPAGISAALAASGGGAQVCVVDKYSVLGGNYYKGFPCKPSSLRSHLDGQDRRDAAKLFERLKQSNVRILTNCELWAAEPAILGAHDAVHRLYLNDSGRQRVLDAQRLILAMGAYDRPLPLPGWTLPGVMTAGAAQLLIKAHGIAPGRRVLLAGTGPLLLSLASQLLKVGAEVVSVLEVARPFSGWTRLLIPGLAQRRRIAEGLRYLRTLAMHHVRYRFGHTVFCMEGGDCVEGAIIGRVDAGGTPVAGSEERVPADAVCLGFGLLPLSDVGRLLNCKLRYDASLAGYAVEQDASMRTSVPGLFAVGDCANIDGKDAALLQGQIAGLSVAADLGHISAAELSQKVGPLRSRLAQERRFSRALAEVFHFREGLRCLATDDTVICRCEEVTLGDVKRAIAGGVTTLNELRSATRVGMGRCQGRYCEATVSHLLSRMTGQYVACVGIFTPRVPLLPVRAGLLSEYADEVPVR